MNKKCSKCNQEKEINCFNLRNINGVKKPFSMCKICEREYNNSRYLNTCNICGIEYKSGKKDSVKCKKCHTKILAQNGAKRFTGLNQSGENNPMYGIQRFGIQNPNYDSTKTDFERYVGRLYEGYGVWRKLVYKRDGYRCVCCGDSKGGNLNAHHLNGYNWDKENRTNIENGITICDKCHINFHKNYGNTNNTKKQFIEFLKSNNIPIPW